MYVCKKGKTQPSRVNLIFVYACPIEIYKGLLYDRKVERGERMKIKRAAALALGLLLLFAAGCGTQEVEDLPDVLLTVNGEEVLTKQDLSYMMMDVEVRASEYGEEERDQKEVFLSYAENLVAYEIAKEYGYDISLDDMRTEYESYLQKIKSDENYEEIQNYMDTLREKMGVTQEEFDEYKIHEEMVYQSAQNLISAIAAEYQNISSAHAIGEEMRRTLIEAASSMEITIAYPGVSELTFEYLVSDEGVEDAVS